MDELLRQAVDIKWHIDDDEVVIKKLKKLQEERKVKLDSLLKTIMVQSRGIPVTLEYKGQQYMIYDDKSEGVKMYPINPRKINS